MKTAKEVVDDRLKVAFTKSGKAYPWVTLAGARYHLIWYPRSSLYIVNVVELKGRPETYGKHGLCVYPATTKFRLHRDFRVDDRIAEKANRLERLEDPDEYWQPYANMLLTHLEVA